MAKKKETILVFGAHSDDFVIGAGGTIAKYAREGKKVISVIFSYGEKSHPWLKEEIIKKTRSQEASQASKILGCKTIFFNLEDQKVDEDYQKKKIEKKLLEIVNKEKPSKIFTHSREDSHVSFGLLVGKDDHKAVHKITLDLYEKIRFKPEIYVYSIWNPVSLRTGYPALYENISQTFSLKLKALRIFRSQRFNAIYPLLFMIFYRAIKNGLKIKKKFGEKFYKIK